jgi:hypothetical protein
MRIEITVPKYFFIATWRVVVAPTVRDARRRRAHAFSRARRRLERCHEMISAIAFALARVSRVARA